MSACRWWPLDNLPMACRARVASRKAGCKARSCHRGCRQGVGLLHSTSWASKRASSQGWLSAVASAFCSCGPCQSCSGARHSTKPAAERQQHYIILVSICSEFDSRGLLLIRCTWRRVLLGALTRSLAIERAGALPSAACTSRPSMPTPCWPPISLLTLSGASPAGASLICSTIQALEIVFFIVSLIRT